MVVNTPYGVQGTGVCGVCSSVRRVMNAVQWDKQSHGHEGVRVARKGWAVGLRRTMNREQLHSKSHQSTITLRGQRGLLRIFDAEYALRHATFNLNAPAFK